MIETFWFVRWREVNIHIAYHPIGQMCENKQRPHFFLSHSKPIRMCLMYSGEFGCLFHLTKYEVLSSLCIYSICYVLNVYEILIADFKMQLIE